MHARHVQLILSDQSLCSLYGVTGESCLSGLQSFDVTQGLPPDVMHDLFEGVIPCVMKHVLRHIISGHLLTLDQLNERLASFPFQGGDKKSRLPPLSRQAVFGRTAMKGSAAEKLCFFRFFSLLLGDCIPKRNAAYEVYLMLRAVVDIVLAPQVCCSAAARLQVLIDDFYSAFKETFPGVNIIPKMHYLIHYPRLLLFVVSVTVSERRLSVGCVILLLVPDDDLPHFAQVTLIVVSGLQHFVLASVLDTKYFDDHFHAYVVENTAHSVIIEDIGHCGEFSDPLYLYKQGNYCFVNPRSAFFTAADQ
ncbi:conserved hypothetical protein [Ixodes scapularis]|uniref:Uncharacterized protein n=1 Tax=Ixodes scapularis TaxID=6945 RepID=B7QIY2_IXOSC|nr:conserved hypothetical protein [Ixodes scapularis]|eukprot:XP_002415139.1 conserved hypothetical protein [Ixodes scapularis]